MTKMWADYLCVPKLSQMKALDVKLLVSLFLRSMPTVKPRVF